MLSKKLQSASGTSAAADSGGISFVGSSTEGSYTGTSSQQAATFNISFGSSAVSGVQTNDLIIVYIANEDGLSTLGTFPTGWNDALLSAYGNYALCFYKFATSSDVSFSYNWSTSGYNYTHPLAIMVVFRNAGIYGTGSGYPIYHSSSFPGQIPSLTTIPAGGAMVTLVANERTDYRADPSWPTTNYEDNEIEIQNNWITAHASYDLDPGTSFSQHTIYNYSFRGILFVLKEEDAQARGTPVTSTDLPSTVVCYTHGVSYPNAQKVDGWYRKANGNLYKSETLFQGGSYSRPARCWYVGGAEYGRFDPSGSVTRAYVDTPGEFFEAAGYDAAYNTTSQYDGDAPLFIDPYGYYYYDRWVNYWMRDYLPSQVQAGANSLCIEFWMMNVNLAEWSGYTAWWMHYGGNFNSGHGFDMSNQYNPGSSRTVRPAIYHGSGTSNMVAASTTSTTLGPSFWQMYPNAYVQADLYDSDYGPKWFHWSYLWDFQNGRVAIHFDGTEIASATNTSRYTAANFDPTGGDATTEYGALVFGCPSEQHSSYGWAECCMAEFIVSIDDTTKQARWGSSFTPSKTPLIAGGS